MTSSVHAGDPLPTNLHSPATPKAATGFGSYSEYLASLGRLTAQFSAHLNDDELWLASFDGDGRCLEWNYCRPSGGNSLYVPSNLPALDGSGVRPHSTVLSSYEFRMVLQTPDENVDYRVVIVAAGNEGMTPPTKDILGLGLDLGPEIFEYAQMCVEHPHYQRHGALPRPWHKVPPALRIGQNALCILEAGPEQASRTAILFLRNGHLLKNSKPRVPTSSVMYPPKRPSQIPEGFFSAANRPLPYYQNTWLVQRFITSGIGSNNSFGKGNFLYVCLAALIELQLSTAPSNVPHIGMHGLQSEVTLEYCGQDQLGTEGVLALSVDPSLIWTRLRNNVDEQRTTLRWMTCFFRKHFDYSNKYIQAAFEDTMGCFKLRLQDLEQSESQLRDHLAAEGTSKSIHMAEMSIRESKRVMLLTALAFIFLPVSLASSVYGMNVQQINSTGHSIRAFVITAVAMCASSVTLWAAFAALQSYRVRMLSREKLGKNTRTSRWHEELIMYGPLGLLRHLLENYID